MSGRSARRRAAGGRPGRPARRAARRAPRGSAAAGRPIARCDPIERRRRPTSTGRGSRRLASAHRCRPAALPTAVVSSASSRRASSPMVRIPSACSFAAVTAPTPHSRSTGSGCRNVALAVRRHPEQPVGLADRAGDLGEVLGAGDADRDRQPDLVAHPLPQRGADRLRLARPAGAARRRRGTPRRSRSPSTSGVVSSKISKTARLASTYAENRGGTTSASGHSRAACRPPIAERTPYALAS